MGYMYHGIHYNTGLSAKSELKAMEGKKLSVAIIYSYEDSS